MKNRFIYEYELIRRKALEVAEQPHAACPNSVAALARQLGLVDSEQEKLIVLILDNKNRVKSTYTVSIGLLDRAQAHAREVYRIAVHHGAARIVMAHNHPSDDPTPSASDTCCTKEIAKAGQIIGIELLDHVIVVDQPRNDSKPYFSFREAGMLPVRELS